MIHDLPDTTTQDVSKSLVRLRESGGAVALGRVLTLIVSADEGEATENAIAATNAASREHPCRVIVLAHGSRAEPTRLDAQIRVGGDAGASEVVVLRLTGELTDQGASVAIPFLLPDTPVVVWWPATPPPVPAEDKLGRLASRRITDSHTADNAFDALRQRLNGFRPGDSDLTWSRITPWRAILTSALEQPPFDRVAAAEVVGPASSAATDLLAGWLRAELAVPVTRRIGELSVRLERASGPLSLTSEHNGAVVLARPGQPDGRVALKARDVADCLAEELRRLEHDVIYEQALAGVADVDRTDLSS